MHERRITGIINDFRVHPIVIELGIARGGKSGGRGSVRGLMTDIVGKEVGSSLHARMPPARKNTRRPDDR